MKKEERIFALITLAKIHLYAEKCRIYVEKSKK